MGRNPAAKNELQASKTSLVHLRKKKKELQWSSHVACTVHYLLASSCAFCLHNFLRRAGAPLPIPPGAPHNLRSALGDLRPLPVTSMPPCLRGDGRWRAACYSAATEMAGYNFCLQMSRTNKHTSASMRSVFSQQRRGPAAHSGKVRHDKEADFPSLPPKKIVTSLAADYMHMGVFP